MPAFVAPTCHTCHQSDSMSLWAEATDIEYFTSDERYSFFECTRCGAIQIFPIPKERLADIYPHNYYSFVSGNKGIATRIKEWLDRRFFQNILATISASQLNVLDVGGGTGWLLDLVKACDVRVATTQVVDLSDEAAAVARAKGHRYFTGPIEAFTSDVAFDVVLLLNLIEHVADPGAVLKNVRELLSSEGIIVIKTPNYESLDARLFRHHNWGGLHCPRHWHLFTKESFERLATNSGLRVEAFSYTQGAPFWAVSLMGWFRKRGLVTINAERPSVYHPLYRMLILMAAIFDVMRAPFSKTSQMFVVLKRS